MPIGKVISYNLAKGYGFIAGPDTNVFYHRQVVEGELPSAGDVVRFDAVPDGRNSPKATSVRIIDPAVLAEADRVFGAA